MILVARARRFITKVHVKQTLGLILIKMLRQRDLGSQDAASLGEHALLTGGQPMLVDITLGEVSHDFGDFIHIAGGDLLNVQLVPAGPVHFLFDDRSTQNLEDLRDLLGADDVSDTHFLGVLHRNIDDQPVGRQHRQLQIFSGHTLDRSLGDGLHLRCAVTRIDDHVADLVTHESSVKSLHKTRIIVPSGLDLPKKTKKDATRANFQAFHAYTFPMATESKIKEDSVAVPVAQGDLDAVSNGTFYNPHEVLGGHLGPDEHEDVVTIRVLRPLAKSVTIITENARTQAVHEHNGVFMALIPAIKTDDGFGVPDYRISTEYEDGSTVVSDDPYRYLPTIGDLDMYLFGEGRHERLWEALGARVLRYDDPLGSNDGVKGEQLVGTAFTVWAPNAHAVRVVGDFNGWNGRIHAMRELGSSGVWELFIPGVETGTIYKYEILNANNEWVMKADPMERSHEIPPRTGSIVVDSVHAWHDENWMDQRAKTDPHNGPVSIYEVHASSWRKDVKNYRELADKLVPYVQKEGFTHVEFMPLAEHPFSGSWGYQVTGYYAIDSRLGGPDDFKYLVEKMHEAGIGVIMDWVPAHFPKDAFALGRFDGTPLYEDPDPTRGEHPDWGTYVFNFGRREVRNFLVANACFWLDEYHIDALRVDAVSSMLYLDYSRKPGQWHPNIYGGRENLEAIDFLKEATATAYKNNPAS